jgi:hypothetical protein
VWENKRLNPLRTGYLEEITKCDETHPKVEALSEDLSNNYMYQCYRASIASNIFIIFFI